MFDWVLVTWCFQNLKKWQYSMHSIEIVLIEIGCDEKIRVMLAQGSLHCFVSLFSTSFKCKTFTKHGLRSFNLS